MSERNIEMEMGASRSSEKKPLIKGTAGNEELEKSWRDYAKQAGVDEFENLFRRPQGGLTSEGKRIHAEWLLNNPDSSPELNNEILFSIPFQYEELRELAKKGDREGTLMMLERMRKLIDKLEQGIKD